MYNHNIISSLTDYIDLVHKKFIYGINTFFTTKSKFKHIEINDIDYDIKEDFILEDGEGQEPEDNTYSGGVYE